MDGRTTRTRYSGIFLLSGPSPSGLCATNIATAEASTQIRIAFPATWQVTNPCDAKTLRLDITPLTEDGLFACSANLDFVQYGVQFEGALLDWIDTNTQRNVYDDILLGITKQTKVDITQTTLPLDFSQPFQIFYEDQLVFNCQ